MTSSNGQLETLARGRFADPPLSAAEEKLVRAAPAGDVAYCGPSKDFDDPSNDPAKAEDWGPEREIRADLIRWLCVDRQARELVDPKGIQTLGAKIPDALDLSFVKVSFPLRLQRSCLLSDLNLSDVELPLLDLQGTWVRSIGADRAVVKASIFLGNGFHAKREVRLLGAQVGGDLECTKGEFENPPQRGVEGSGDALSADGINVIGGVFLNKGFKAEGAVRLLGAQVRGDLDCTKGEFKNRPQANLEGSGVALVADRINVQGTVFLNKRFHADGGVRLLGAEVGGNLDCSEGEFKNPPQANLEGSGVALVADRINVRGNVFLREDFQAEGEVRLLGARVGGDLVCIKGEFKNSRKAGIEGLGDALSADRINVTGSVFLRDGFHAEGGVRLLGAQVGGHLDCTKGEFKNPSEAGVEGSGVALNVDSINVKGHVLLGNKFHAEGRVVLTSGSTGALVDESSSWPASGNLDLEGFVYTRIFSDTKDAKSRLKWLSRQGDFPPQPYRQLAKVLADEGDDRGAQTILREMEHRRRAKEDKERYTRLWSWILRVTIGYGYAPGRSLWGLVGLTLLGFLIFWGGYNAGNMVPTEKDAYWDFEFAHRPPPHYPRFHAFIYSLENSLPLVKLGQADRWQPAPGPQDATRTGESSNARFGALLIPSVLLRVFLWIQILLGWILATFFVAAVTGIVHKD